MEPTSPGPGPAPGPFRWQAFLQKSGEPLFFLNRQRRLLFVNRAFEELTGLSLREARGLACRRRSLPPNPEKTEILAGLLAPPREVFEGRPGRCRRLLSPTLPDNLARATWWDIDFLPFRDDQGLLGILGKITPRGQEESLPPAPLPEKIAALRDQFVREFTPENLHSELPAMQRVIEQVRLAGQTDVPVLLVGEEGTGKTWLARCIHEQGSRRDAPFQALDCALLPPWILENILLGQGGKPVAGTWYLRRPTGLPREIQSRFCQWLRSDKPAHAPRVLAGLCPDPEEEIRAGRLLPEFYCLLSTLVISVPPLRQRREDLPALVDRFLVKANAAASSQVQGLSPEAMQMLGGHSWPGNLRELYQVLRGACLRAETNRIEAGDLPFYLRAAPVSAPRPWPLDSILEQVERRLIVLALRQARDNKAEAAQLLSIWRQRLVRRMEALGIENTGTEPGK